MADAFLKTFKKNYIVFGDLEDAHVSSSQLPSWMEDNNEKAPLKALKMLSPREFIKQKLAG